MSWTARRPADTDRLWECCKPGEQVQGKPFGYRIVITIGNQRKLARPLKEVQIKYLKALGGNAASGILHSLATLITSSLLHDFFQKTIKLIPWDLKCNPQQPCQSC